MQQCAGCRRWNWPAVWRCGECGSWEHEWHEVPFKGQIFAWTRTWHEFGAPKEFELPFVSVVVTLDGAGNRRLLGTLLGDTRDVHIGASVQGQIGRVTIDAEQLPALQLYENFSAQGVASLIDHGFCSYESVAEFVRFDNLIAPSGKLRRSEWPNSIGDRCVFGPGRALRKNTRSQRRQCGAGGTSYRPLRANMEES